MKKNIFKTLAVTVLSAVSLTAWAVDPVSYLDGTGTEQTCADYTVVESSSSAVTWNAGWYVVSGDVTIANSITFNGNVNLILCDGATLTITGDENEIGIDGYDGDVVYDLTVYGQSEGSGSMSVTGGPAIINVNYLTINGGSVEAIGDDYGIGFGENVTINGGELTVTGKFQGFNTGNGTVTINGGKLTVTVEYSCFGAMWPEGGTVTINGGELTATGGESVVKKFSVINAIAGTGWTDAAGTEGETAIAVSTEGQDLSAYKKVQFSAAANSPYADYDVTTDANKDKSGDALTALQVTFNGTKWYIIEDNSTSDTEGTVTLLAADTDFGTSVFSSNSSNAYSSSTVNSMLVALTAEGGAFASVKDAIVNTDLTDVGVTGAKLYLLSIVEASPLPKNVRRFSDDGWWWLRSPGDDDYEVAAAAVDGWDGYVDDFGISVMVYRYVRPALQLDLSKVTFDTETNTFSVAPTTSVATPTLTPAEGEYTSSQSVTISTTTEGAKIYFTVDGTEPTTSSQLYNALMPIDLPAENGTYTIKAIAVKDGMANSEIASATYIISSTTGIGETDADAAKSNIWYDLNGRHYQGKPTAPGVYINNRQKYVVK